MVYRNGSRLNILWTPRHLVTKNNNKNTCILHIQNNIIIGTCISHLIFLLLRLYGGTSFEDVILMINIKIQQIFPYPPIGYSKLKFCIDHHKYCSCIYLKPSVSEQFPLLRSATNDTNLTTVEEVVFVGTTCTRALFLSILGQHLLSTGGRERGREGGEEGREGGREGGRERGRERGREGGREGEREREREGEREGVEKERKTDR